MILIYVIENDVNVCKQISSLYKHFRSNRPTMQRGLLWYVMYVSMMCIFVLLTSFSILQVWDELLFPISSLINDTTVNLFTRYVK